MILHLISFSILILALSSPAATKYWRGGTSTSAKVAANWSDSAASGADVSSAAPMTGDAIVLDGIDDAAQRAMTWDLDDVAPASWTQNGYTNVVTFKTGRNGYNVNSTLYQSNGVLADDGTNRILSVSGAVSLLSGTWTHETNPRFANYYENKGSPAKSYVSNTNEVGVYRLLVKTSGAFTLGENAKIDVSKRGYAYGNGPGYPNDHRSINRQGACHGGSGGRGNDGESNAYGSFREADTLGSGSGSAGGGSFVLVSSDVVTLDGRIAADAAPSSGWYAGAGGGISIVAKSIAGAATACLSADGGTAPNGKGGGGGRIALRLTGSGNFDGFLGTLRAAARKEPSSGSNCATGGTIYRELASDGAGGGELTFDGIYVEDPVYSYVCAPMRDIYTMMTGSDLAYKPNKIILRNGASFGVAPGETWDLSATEFEGEAPSGYANSIRLFGGTMILPEHTWTEADFFNAASGSVIRVKSDGTGVWTVGAGVTVTTDYPLSVEGALEILSGGTLTHTANGGSKAYGIEISVTRSVTNHAGGVITAYGKGYSYRNGPGKPNTGSGNRGGSHAGIAYNEWGDICYGSPLCPVTMGSGGTSYSGGGTVRLVVTGEVVNDGEIQANGPVVPYHAGAGGSVWITAARLKGTGAITANGGKTTNGSWPTAGGGGRVAVWLTDADADFSECDATRIAAFGGDQNGVIRSGAGTVYLKKGSEAEDEGTLIIANSNAVAVTGYRTEIGSDMADFRVGKVEIRDAGILRIRGGHTIEVGGDWSNAGKLVCETNSVVSLVTTGTSTVTGTNSFCTLSCAVPGKTVMFGTSASLLTILPAGRFVMSGDETSPLTLCGDVADRDWLLDAEIDSDFSVMNYLVVSHSDASSVPQTLVANNSDDGGDNSENWTFMNIRPGDPITWTGVRETTTWTDARNWNPERTPCETDVITIPAGCPSYPALSVDQTLNSLVIESGASLALGGWNLAITNCLTLAGTLVGTATETVSVGGNLDCTSGAISGTFASLVLNGSGAQSVALAAVAPTRIDVTKSTGSVAWTTGFSAGSFHCTATAPLAMSFASGGTVTLKELHLSGAVGGVAALTLAPTGWDKWKLCVTDAERVSGVSVSKCDASVAGGLAIHDDSPYVDGDGNVNWVFGEDAAVWQGGASGSFDAAENWSVGRVPGAADRVVIDSGAVTMGVAQEVASLSLGGGGEAASLVANAALTVAGGVDVRSGGALSLNAASSVGGSLFVRSGGTMTHAANSSTAAYRMDLAVAGNVTIEQDGTVDVTGKGFATGYGPGAPGGNAAASHGGRGANGNQPDKVKDCYGSMTEPTELGSGGNYPGMAGGGAVKIACEGEMRIDGLIVADGTAGAPYYTGSGGSVWLVASSFVGTGTVRADGGPLSDSWSYTPGGGGRVAIYQTASSEWSFSGTVQAHGGYRNTGSTTVYTPYSSGGTVYRKLAGERGGLVLIENGNGINAIGADFWRPFATELPVVGGAEGVKWLRDVRVVVSAAGSMSLTEDAEIRDLELPVGCQLRLNGHRLTIRERTHRRGTGWVDGQGVATGLMGTVVPEGGEVVWRPVPMCVILK